MNSVRELFDSEMLNPVYMLTMASEVDEKIMLLEFIPEINMDRIVLERFVNETIKDLRILELTIETLSFVTPNDKDIEILLNKKINRFYERLDNILFTKINKVQ
jgi:secreted protein with Ig-like and vWFA domain